MAEERFAIGVDVGGTEVKVVAVESGGHVRDECTAATADDAKARWKEDARQLIDKLEQRCGRRADWVGVCAPGIVAPDGHSIWWMMGKMESSMGFEWAPWLGRATPVPVYNDAQAALLAETRLGAARGAKNVVLLTLGTGVGGAAMVDGRLLRGHLGRAGHLGHMTVDFNGPGDLANTPGSIEDHIGNHNVAARSEYRYTSTRDLVAAFRAGDAQAGEVWLRSVKALAAHLAGVINALDPELLVLGGGIAEAEAALLEPLAGFLDRFEWRPHGRRVRIVRAALGTEAGAVGAACGAMAAETEKI